MAAEAKCPKYTYVYITMETSNVNHTSLYKSVCKMDGFRGDTFKRMYLTPSVKYGKNKTSREHDEVISRCVPLLCFDKKFLETKTKKSGVARHVVIYRKVLSTDEAAQRLVTSDLLTFFKRYRRKEGEIVVKKCYNAKDFKA